MSTKGKGLDLFIRIQNYVDYEQGVCTVNQKLRTGCVNYNKQKLHLAALARGGFYTENEGHMRSGEEAALR